MERSNFKEWVYSLTKQIPEGKVSSYGEIAKALGRPKAARAVGKVLNINPTPIVVPCHRVVHSDGKLGGYGGRGGRQTKLRLLSSEGVEVANGCVENFESVLFTDFKPIRT